MLGFLRLSRFQYRQLTHAREVRLVTLLPGYGFESIRCNISHSSLDESPNYEAVSYCWGSSKRTRSIDCNGSQLHVTDELHTVLRNLRRRSSVVKLWTDQISIDQDNVAERSAQVQLMGEIFGRARKVLIWLGVGNKSSRNALDLARRVLEISEAHPEIEMSPDNLDRLRLPHWSHSDWGDLGSLLGKDWFRRTWTIQETVMAARAIIMCGDDELDWNRFSRLIRTIPFTPNLKAIGKSETSTPPAVRHILGLDQCRKSWKNGQRESLADLLIKFKSSQSSDPKDKVYGLLGMGDQAIDITPDYLMKVEDIYIDTATRIITKTLPNTTNGYSLSNKHWRAGMGIILSAGLSNQRLGLPSWVPDWSVNSVSESFWKDMRLGHQAGGKFVGTIEVLDGNKLQVYARILDRIVSTTTALEYDKLSGAMRLQDSVADWFEAARSRAAQLPRPYPTGGSTMDAFKATIIANRVPAGDIYRTASREDREIYYHAFDFLHDIRSSQWEGIRFLPEAISSHHLQRILFETNGRLFFTTKNGYMGLASKGAQPGDLVAVIGGANVPILLRPHNGDYKLIADCYVHGLMRDTVPMYDIIEQPVVLV